MTTDRVHRTPVVRGVLFGLPVALLLWACFVGGVVFAAKAFGAELYTLEADGIHLVEPLSDGDHLNVRRDDGVTVNVHIEAKCVGRSDAECAGKPGLDARWAGATFVPWSVFGVGEGACVVWVQHSGTGYHFGEQGEEPFCVGSEPAPEPSPEPSPDPVPTPTDEPTEVPEPEPTPELTPDPVPDPLPEPSPDPTPTPTPEPAPEPTPDPVTPEPTPDPDSPDPAPECPGTDSECDAGDQWPIPEPAPEPIQDPTPRDPDLPELPETGVEVGALGVIAVVLIATGGLFYTIYRRNQ